MEQEIVWKGSTSVEHRKKEFTIAFSMLIISLIFELLFISISITTSIEMGLFIILILLIILIGILITVLILALLPYILKRFPSYIVTREKLLIEEWSFIGVKKEKSFSISKINTIYYPNNIYLEQNSIIFYFKTVETILEECPGLPQYDCFITGDFKFEFVDSPEELIRVLHTIIPLKKHPTLYNIYQRIENNSRQL